jgi:hypothetical protein
MIHVNRPLNSRLMLVVTRRALADGRMERSWLAVDQFRRVGVARYALRTRHPGYRRVTGGAVLSDKSMRFRQRPGPRKCLPR